MKKKAFLYAFISMPIIAIVTIAIFKLWPTEDLKRLWPVDAFSLVDQSDHKVELDHLRRNVWVANFLFTRCQEQCPLIIGQLKRLQGQFSSHPHFKIVSFTVDPKNDSPHILKEYATKVHAKPENWLFLTGPREALEQLFLKSFKVPGSLMGDEFEGGLNHSSHLVLVDAQGWIRGYYQSMDEEAFEKLTKGIKKLLREVF